MTLNTTEFVPLDLESPNSPYTTASFSQSAPHPVSISQQGQDDDSGSVGALATHVMSKDEDLSKARTWTILLSILLLLACTVALVPTIMFIVGIGISLIFSLASGLTIVVPIIFVMDLFQIVYAFSSKSLRWVPRCALGLSILSGVGLALTLVFVILWPPVYPALIALVIITGLQCAFAKAAIHQAKILALADRPSLYSSENAISVELESIGTEPWNERAL